MEDNIIKAENIRGLSGFVDYKTGGDRAKLNKLIAYITDHLKDTRSHKTDDYIFAKIAGIVSRIDHNKLIGYIPEEHSKLDDKAISKKRTWSSARTSKEIKTGDAILKKEIERLVLDLVQTDVSIEAIESEISKLASSEVVEGLAGLLGKKLKEIKVAIGKRAEATHEHGQYATKGELKVKAEKLHEHKDYAHKAELVKKSDKGHKHSDYLTAKDIKNKSDKDHKHIEYASKLDLVDKANIIHEHGYATQDDIDSAIKSLPKPPTFDIQEEIDTKLGEVAPLNHRHRIGDIAGLQSTISGDAYVDTTGDTMTGDLIGTDFVSTRSGAVTRVGNFISSIQLVGGRELEYTRNDDNYVVSINDGTRVTTIERDSSNNILSWSIA